MYAMVEEELTVEPGGSSSPSEKDLMNEYVLGMAAFSLGIALNLVSVCMLVSSGMLKKSSVGIYLLILLLSDSVYLVTHTTMSQFYSRWIHVDIFEEAGNSGVLLCQLWNFLQEFTVYFRFLVIVIILIDRYLHVSGKASAKDLRKVVAAAVFVSVILSAGLAAFWAYQVKEKLGPGPYRFGSCRIAPPMAPETSGIWFYMELFVHIIYPDVVLNVSCVVALAILSSCVYNREEAVLEYSNYNLTKCILALGCAHLVLQLPYLVVNVVFLYVDARWDVYSFSDDVQRNLQRASVVTKEVKDFIFAANFFVLIFVRQFRRAVCKP